LVIPEADHDGATIGIRKRHETLSEVFASDTNALTIEPLIFADTQQRWRSLFN
jgi:hypothetical protein